MSEQVTNQHQYKNNERIRLSTHCLGRIVLWGRVFCITVPFFAIDSSQTGILDLELIAPTFWKLALSQYVNNFPKISSHLMGSLDLYQLAQPLENSKL